MGGGKGRAIGRSVGGMALLAMLLGVLLLCLPGGRSDAAPAARTYVGVASCAGSTCHGRMEGDGNVVRQDELMRRQEPSTPGVAPSRAFAVLNGQGGPQIAATLGLGAGSTRPQA